MRKKVIVIYVMMLCILYRPIQSEAAKKQSMFSSFFREDEYDILAGMSLEEKLGQVLIFGFMGTAVDEDYKLWLSTGKLGNVKIFLRNIESKEQLRQLIDEIVFRADNSVHGVPPFIATDMEGGIVNHIRYPDITLAPAAGLIGATGDPDNNRIVSRLIALTLFDIGVNMNFAPCADVLTNPKNRVIGTRSYSSDPEVVYAMVKAFIEEHRKFGILPTVKHYPGHGMADFDTHLMSDSVDTTLSELIEVHLLPYQQLIQENEMDGCMVSHIIYNKIDPARPAAFSPVIVNDILRKVLKFDGVVVTDDLEMEGSQGYAKEIEEAFILAFRAGSDMFLVSHTKEEQEKLIQNTALLFRNGTLSEDDLDRKVLRVLKTKKKYLEHFYAMRGEIEVSEKTLKRSAEASKEASYKGIVKLSSHIDGTIPDFFKEALNKELNGLVLAPTSDFVELAKKYLPTWDVTYIRYFPDKKSNFKKVKVVEKQVNSYDFVILGMANERQIPYARACVNAKVPFGILSIDNPYFTGLFKQEAQFIVTSFGPYSPAIDVLFNCVFETGDFYGTYPYNF